MARRNCPGVGVCVWVRVCLGQQVGHSLSMPIMLSPSHIHATSACLTERTAVVTDRHCPPKPTSGLGEGLTGLFVGGGGGVVRSLVIKALRSAVIICRYEDRVCWTD